MKQHTRIFTTRLLNAWRAAGHTTGVDDWLRVRRLLQSLPVDTPPEQLKYLVAPLLATNPEAQKELYALIDRFAAELPQPQPWWKSRWIIAVGLVVLLLAAGVATKMALDGKKRTISPYIYINAETGGQQELQVDDNLVAQSNEAVSEIVSIDTVGKRIANVDWHPGSTPPNVTVTGKTTGTDTFLMVVRLKRWSGWFNTQSRNGYVQVEMPFFLVVTVTGAPTPEVTFQLPDSLPLKPYHHHPDISTLLPQDIPLFSWAYAYWDATKTGAALGWLLLLLQIGYWVLLLRHKRLKKLQEQQTDTNQAPLRRQSNDKPPYTWQLKIPDMEAVDLGSAAAGILAQLRSRSHTDYAVFDAARTVHATIREGGRIRFLYKQPTRPDEYLMLLDMPSPHHHQAQLFDLLYRTFEQQEVLIVRFYYRNDLRLCWNEQHPEGITLAELQHRYGDHRLLIVGKADTLVSPSTGELLRWTKLFEAWKFRSLLSPKPAIHWGAQEEVLGSLFRLVPATMEGLEALTAAGTDTGDFDAARWKMGADADTGPVHLPARLSPDAVLATLDAEYVEYQNGQRDERLLLWLAACAVSPVLHWDATLFFGRWADDQVGSDPLLQVDNLLRLNRLSWFSAGTMPENARRALLGWLADERPEALTRLRAAWKEVLENNLEALKKAAEEQKKTPFEETAAYDELRMILLVNELALNEIRPDQLPPETRRQLERELQERVANEPADFVALELLRRAEQREADELRREAPVRDPEPPFPPLWRGWRWQLPLLFAGLCAIWAFNAGGQEACKGSGAEYKGVSYCIETPQDSLVLLEYMFCDTTYERENSLLNVIDEALQQKGLSNPAPQDMANWVSYYDRGKPYPVSAALVAGDKDSLLLKTAFNIIRKDQPDSASFYQNIPIAWWNKGTQFYNAGMRELACVCFKKMNSWPGLDTIFTEEERRIAGLVTQDCQPGTTTTSTGDTLDVAKPGKGQCRTVAPATIALALRNRILTQAEYNTIGSNRGGVLDRNTALVPLPEGVQVTLLDSTGIAYRIRYGGKTGYLVKVYQGKPTLLPCNADPVPPSIFAIPQMIPVKGGTFTMGCTPEQGEDCGDDEKPAHQVTVSDFGIGKTEVTIEQYLTFCDETKSHYPIWLEAGNDYNIETGTDDYYKTKGMSRANKKYPVTGISWDDAVAYCQWLSQKTNKRFRLPSEAEWEFAARGGLASKKTKFSGSNNIDEVAWYTENTNDSGTRSVATKAANELGLYDMSGNVWEWCSDWYGEDYYKNSPSKNPGGPDKGSYRVLRGGSWGNDPGNCRVSYRNGYNPDNRNYYGGFRVASSPQ